jgi:glycosyltransferase involved in cell wall biosynthesis
MEPAPSETSLLVIAYYYPPVNTSGAARPGRFVKFLECHGLKTSVVTGGTTAKPGRLGRVITYLERSVGLNGERLFWTPAAVHAAGKVLRDSRGTRVAVFSTSPPAVTHVVAMYLKFRFNVRWIADFRDPLSGNPFHGQWISRISRRILEELIFTFADAVIANTDQLARLWAKTHTRWYRKVEIIWNGFDPDEQLPRPSVPPSPRKRIVHTGDLYGARHPGRLIQAISRLISAGLLDGSKIELRLVGPIDGTLAAFDSPEYRALLQSGTVVCSGVLVSRQEALQEIVDADYLLLLDLNAANSTLQVPAKVFDYVRTAKPIIAFTAKESPTMSILDMSGLEYIAIDPSDSEPELDRQLLEFLSKDLPARAPSESFLESFDGTRQTESLRKVLSAVTSRI